MKIYYIQYKEGKNIISVQIFANDETEARKKFRDEYDKPILNVLTVGDAN